MLACHHRFSHFSSLGVCLDRAGVADDTASVADRGGVLPRKPYPTDLTDARWAILEPLVPPAKPGGSPREMDRRKLLKAIFYQARGGASWRMLPPGALWTLPQGTVHYYAAGTRTASGNG